MRQAPYLISDMNEKEAVRDINTVRSVDSAVASQHTDSSADFQETKTTYNSFECCDLGALYSVFLFKSIPHSLVSFRGVPD